MKRTFTILASLMLFLFAAPSYGCNAADQVRLFPFGKLGNSYIYMQVALHRDADFLKNDSYWYASIYLSRYDERFSLLSKSKIDEVEFSGADYTSVLRQVFSTQVDELSKNKDFLVAKLERVILANYAHSCSYASFSYKPVAKRVELVVGADKSNFEITALRDIRSTASVYLKDAAGWENVAIESIAPHEIDYDSLYQENLLMGSVRTYLLGDERLTLVNVGIGQIHTSADGTERYPSGVESELKVDTSNLVQGVFQEELIHHGNMFDFAVVEKLN
ncbi:MAG: hypothetical protein OIF34_00090 [Porticoccaceae bacterium]|nr:hypothetical protein [Porticoccaceae bacterium]